MRASLIAWGTSLTLLSVGIAACSDDESSGSGGETSSSASTTVSGTSSASSGAAGGDPNCGDGLCQSAELCGTCPGDCGVCSGDPINVTRGPYLQSGTSESVVVRWRTEVASESVVAYGSEPGSLTQLASSSGSTTEHEVALSGLSPDSTIYYAFGTPESELVGGDADHHLLTAPPKGTARATRVWVLGDAGTANQNQRDVRDAYLATTGTRGTDLLLLLGDNAYNDGTDAEYQAAVFDIYPDVLRNVVTYTTLGNHDGHSADSTTQTGPYYDIFTLPTRGQAGGLASGTEAYYAFDYGQVHFVCLDSYDSDTDPAGPMMTWLENDLSANDQKWLVAFFHHPPYTKGSHNSDTEGDLIAIRQDALPILEAHGVDLVLTGHSHAYERSKLINAHYGLSSSFDTSMEIDAGDGDKAGDGAYSRAIDSTAGAVYVVAGSSGKIGGGPLNHPAMYVSLNQLGSVMLDVDGDALDATFIGSDAAVLDTFTITK